ncbi:MAG: hypothetical protein AAGI53_15145 [Planctomycetota bacterium]
MARSENVLRPEELMVQTRAQRDEAEALLASLVAARSASERNLSAIGQRDLLKSVTGRSSMDNAIESTRRLVASFDRVLIDLRGDLTDDELALLGEVERDCRKAS